jgi:regulatory protein
MAFAYVRTASRLKGRGRLRIQRELENRGISKDLAREALADIPADEDVRSIERFLARQRATTDADTPQGRRRLFQRLLRRGFPPDVIARILGHGVQ